MRAGASRHFVKVPPPSVQGVIGMALRHAFPMNGREPALKPFEDLLDRLN
jgi:hypothetical protein